MHAFVVKIFTERSIRTGGRLSSRQVQKWVEGRGWKTRSAVAIWTKHAAVEISMCRGCEKHIYRSRRRWTSRPSV